MLGWLGRYFRVAARDNRIPNTPNRVSGANTSTAQAAPSGAESSTAIGDDGAGYDLFIIGYDTIGDPATYLGNAALPEYEEQTRLDAFRGA